MHDSVVMAVMDAFEDLLDTVRGVRFAVELSRDYVLEELAAGYSVEQERKKDVCIFLYEIYYTRMCVESCTSVYSQVEYEVVEVFLLYTVV